MPNSASTGYRATADALLAEIRDGKDQPGLQFPSLTAIMRRFGVTRITAKRAVDDLKRRIVDPKFPPHRVLVHAPPVVREST